MLGFWNFSISDYSKRNTKFLKLYLFSSSDVRVGKTPMEWIRNKDLLSIAALNRNSFSTIHRYRNFFDLSPEECYFESLKFCGRSMI